MDRRHGRVARFPRLARLASIRVPDPLSVSPPRYSAQRSPDSRWILYRRGRRGAQRKGPLFFNAKTLFLSRKPADCHPVAFSRPTANTAPANEPGGESRGSGLRRASIGAENGRTDGLAYTLNPRGRPTTQEGGE